jgi:VWFA-related protein
MRISRFFCFRKLTLIFLLSGAFSSGAFAQDDKDDVLRVNTDLIQTNVTVTDKNGNFVNGLKEEDFVLKIEGKPAKIDFFEPVINSKSVFSLNNNPNSEKGAQGPAAATPSTAVTLRERKYIFFVDDFHMSLDSMGRTRSAIAHFIDSDMMPRDQVIIIAASGNLGFLQQFTSNKAVLRAALAKLRVFPNLARDNEQPPMPEYLALRVLNNDSQVGDYYLQKLMQAFNSKLSNALSKAAALEMVKQRANNIVAGMAASTKNSLSSLENVLLTSTQLKGRKLLFFFSDGFYLEDKHVAYNTSEGLQRAVNLATRSGASIYTIDARGLFNITAVDATGERPFDPQGRLDRGSVGEAYASQEGLATLSNLTGGRFLKNQNYFDKWIDRYVDENASYYTLAWTPDKDEQLNKKFKDIEVSVAGRSDLSVRFQRGYLTSWDKPGTKGKDTGSSKKNIPVSLSLNYLDIPSVGGVVHSAVQIAVGGLNYGEKGDKPAALDLVGIILDIEGKRVGDFKTGLNFAPLVSGTSAAGEQDIYYNPKNPLAPGTYQVQVAVRDTQTGDAGSVAQWIEIPDLSKRQLTMSSLFLGGKLIGNGGSTAAMQFQYSVDHRFSKPANLDFTSFIYNAARGNNGSGETNLATRVEVINNEGKTVIDSNLQPLVTKGNDDLARIPVRGAIRQQLDTPGRYLLRVTVADNIANTKTVQQALFTIE